MQTEFHLAQEESRTTMRWVADVRVAGPIGSMGQRVFQPIVNQQVTAVLDALEEQVAEAKAASSRRASPDDSGRTGARRRRLFGAMAATLGISFQRSSDAEAGAVVTGLVALAVTLVFSLDALSDSADVGPFLLAGLIAPGGSHMLYVLAVKEIGASRAAVIAGAAPLVAVTIALTILGEPSRSALVVGRGDHRARRRRTRRRA